MFVSRGHVAFFYACLWLSLGALCPSFIHLRLSQKSGLEKGVSTKGVFALEESLESRKSLIESILLNFEKMVGPSFVFHNLGDRLSLEFPEHIFEKTPFPKDPLFRSRICPQEKTCRNQRTSIPVWTTKYRARQDSYRI